VAYTGAAIALREGDKTRICSDAYAALQRELPEADYRDIARGSSFRRDVAANADHFFQQLRFYQIRPLYIRTLALLHSAGVPYVQATLVISAASFFLLGLLLFAWSKTYLAEWRAAIAIPLLLIAPVIFTSARTGSPDGMSALAVTFGVYVIFERQRWLIGAAILLLSLLIRTDNVIFVLLLFVSLALTVSNRRTRVIAAGLVLLSLAVVLTLNRVEHSYPWPVLMQNTASPIVNPAEVAPTFGMTEYLSAVHDMVDEAAESSALVFPFLAALALLSRKLSREWTRLIEVVLFSWAAHVILFPHIEDRYFVAGAAVIGVGSAAALLSPRVPQEKVDA
jgi:hypothetical protein